MLMCQAWFNMKQKPFDHDLYKKVKTDDLILFSIGSVLEKDDKCCFEKLIQQCYDSFPMAFSFSSISKWPDARRLDRALRYLRSKKLISGNPKTCFVLTKTGKKTAEQVLEFFSQRKLKI